MTNIIDTDIQRKLRNEKQRIRYANRTEEEKEKDRVTDRKYYHSKHSDASYYVKGGNHKESPAPEWYIDACKDSEAWARKEIGGHQS